MSRKTKIINGFVFFVWIALISLLLYRNHEGATLGKTKTLTGSIDKAISWYDIYAGPKKIGFASTTYEKVGDEIIIKDEREIKVAKDRQNNLLTTRLKCISDSRFSLKSFEYSSHFKDEKGIKATGKVDADNIIFFLESSEKLKTYKTPTNGREFYLPTTFIPVLVRKNPPPDSAFTVPLLDLNSLLIHNVKVVLEEIRPVKVGINVVSLYKFRLGNSVWWSNDKGIIVKEENAAGFTLYSQVEAIAKAPSDNILFDYTALPFFKSNKLFANTEILKRLKIRIKGFKLNPEIYIDSMVTHENNILTIRKEGKDDIKSRTYKLPYIGNKVEKYLRPDEWVSSDYKPLHDTGVIYARSNQYDAFLLSEYLTSYLYNLIRIKPMFILQSSEKILETLNGDFLERTVMFPSYSRAAGLPTRTVGGLIYVNGYFYFHAWPEVWFDKWIPVDPTFFQFPADVTHIPLKEGTMKDIISLVDELKNIKIEVLEAL